LSLFCRRAISSTADNIDLWRDALVNLNFVCKCVEDTIEGLQDGLSHFSGSSRAAVIYAITPEDPMRIYDPQSLLRGHEPIFDELYLVSGDWRNNVRPFGEIKKFQHMVPEKNLELTGLISWGGRSSSVFYQMWFTEHHADMCCIGPTECWLEHAAWRFSHDVSNEEELYTGISGSFLSEYSTHAVRDYVVDQMNVILGWDTPLRIYPILDAVLGISRTREEGQWPVGELIFSDVRSLPELEFFARFPEMGQPSLTNFKHVRKLLLSVEDSDRRLVSEGKTILGIAGEKLPAFSIIADYRGRQGFLRINDEAVCSFSDGRFKSSTHQANLVNVEEILLESSLDDEAGNRLYKIITSVVHSAESHEHGCTLVIDLNEQPVQISGQRLEKPLDLRLPQNLELSESLAKVDGALHIGADTRLHGFACLLDGRTVPGEDRARGARYNSALRFTSEHDNIVVVVVSSDRPVSVIQEGVELSAQCQWRPELSFAHPHRTLKQWIDTSDE
jgi:DNA integrity scanning protein DisA with diadenylate cyclase activity